MASKNALTEPLLDAEECAEAHVSTVDNVREAVEESQQLKEQLETNPSYEPLITKPQLEYEPSDIDTAETKQENVENTKFTLNEPVWQTCPYCNTTSETTTVNAFGRCTCLWVCILLLLVLCFPLCWIPFFWKSCQDTKHFCTFCSKELGRCEAKCCQFNKKNEKLDGMDNDDDIEKRLAEAGEVTL